MRISRSQAVRLDETRRRDPCEHRSIRPADRRRAGRATNVTNHGYGTLGPERQPLRSPWPRALGYDRDRMSSIEQKFAKLSTDYAPGQEVRQVDDASEMPLRGDPLPGVPVDFSHGDVNETAFGPTPGALEEFVDGVHRGGPQAYTEYRGGAELRDRLAGRLAAFTGRPVSSERELIITPGTQGALFLAIGATVTAGDRVAIVRPDYFANRKLVEFLGAEIVPVRLDYLASHRSRGSRSRSARRRLQVRRQDLPLFQPEQPDRRDLLARRDRAHRGTGRPGTASRSSSTSSIRAWCIRGTLTRICVRRRWTPTGS